MLDQCAWLDALDVDAARVYFSEHHGSEDGGSPSPIVVASAVAARTRRLAITVGAILAPLYHPIRLAEDLAVLDLVSGGRLTVILAAGYRDADRVLLGVEPVDRPGRVEEAVATLSRAWSGSIRVTGPPRGRDTSSATAPAPAHLPRRVLRRDGPAVRR